MDHVLRVVQHDALEAAAIGRLVGAQGSPDRVEAAGLGGRSGSRADHRADARAVERGDGGDRVGIIGVAADVKAVIVVIEGAHAIVEHAADHLALLPGGHEDGDRARFGGGRQAGDIGAAHPQPQTTPQPQRDPDQVDEKVAGAEDQEPDGGEQADLAHEQGARVQQRPAPIHPAPPNR